MFRHFRDACANRDSPIAGGALEQFFIRQPDNPYQLQP
jgi:hypothetical protein